MLRRLVQWLKKFFQRLFGGKQTPAQNRVNVQKELAPPLSDTDLEFLFTDLLEGVHQARGQGWAQKWLYNVEHRIPTERWVEWLQRFGEKLLAARTPNNELAARLVQLGDLGVGEVGDVAYNIGMQLLTRNQGEPIWEYEGPDALGVTITDEATSSEIEENLSGEALQTVTLDELFLMLQQDQHLRQQVAEQLAMVTDDPEVLIQALIDQLQANDESAPEEEEEEPQPDN
ncbi:hypothetical protein [Cylindrospermum sp. FACHB-282]|uniref:hypothetical protein n=1 Tax=Cylindrospermum sp. FACHB-282 TaxID=2692794 RepID=UPI001F553AD7|nr:hypothetical protein [Cylindrospermum sp. FACHB-282]